MATKIEVSTPNSGGISPNRVNKSFSINSALATMNQRDSKSNVNFKQAIILKRNHRFSSKEKIKYQDPI
jgi:hypothetical protein